MQAILFRDLGEYARSRAGFERALEIREASFGPDHTQVAWTLVNYGYLLAKLGEYEQARQCYERSLSIQQATFGPTHFTSTEPTYRLGELAFQLGDFDRSREHYEENLRLVNALSGEESSAAARARLALAWANVRLGDTARARRLFDQSIAMEIDGLALASPRSWHWYYNHACLAALVGDREQALDLLQKWIDTGSADAIIFDDPDLNSLRGLPEFAQLEAVVRERLESP
jgi:tetratricopeptide (TPR) repeat protein